jgi:hypothetical protein
MNLLKSAVEISFLTCKVIYDNLKSYKRLEEQAFYRLAAFLNFSKSGSFFRHI